MNIIKRSFNLRIYSKCMSIYSPPTRLAHVQLTSEKYPSVKRGKYSEISSDDLKKFKTILPGRVLMDDLDCYNTDWIKTVKGASKVVLRPKSTEEVSKILKYCNDRNLAVCPQGGNTGLAGGSVPVFDEIILSTSLMNKVISFDQISGALVCQAGCILEALDNQLAEKGFMMPLDLGAKGTCQIGGNLSTNAGGLRVIRYGSLHGSVLGIEAVLANGDVIDSLSTLRKDNTGYDLKQLFIGAEGTIGVITKVAIACPIRPLSTQVAFIGVPSIEMILKTFVKAKNSLAEVLSAFEFLDNEAMELVQEQLKLQNPIEQHPFYVLIEVSGSNAEHNEEKLNTFLENMMNEGLIVDGTIATESKKIANIWSIRERIAEAHMHKGYSYKYDVSLPVEHIYTPVLEMQKRLKSNSNVTNCYGYGHLGDANIHLNIGTKEYDPEVKKLIEPFIFELTSKYKGSVSAEHGLGFNKANCIHYTKSKSAVKLMKQLKTMFDPKCILNPYKVFPHDI